MLRITGTLFTKLLDKIDVLDLGKDDLDMSTKPNKSKFFNYLENVLKIKKPMVIIDNKVQLRSFNGQERLKILEQINLVDLFPDLEKVRSVQHLWRKFFDIYASLKNPNGYSNEQMTEVIKKSTLEWGELFVKIYWRESVTPYIHAFVDHLNEQIATHGDVVLWTMQGLEKLNDILTKEFYMCTNKHEDFLLQMIQRRNRMEILLLFESNPEALFDLIHSAPTSTWDRF